jgi:DnaK suppressor protein
MVSNGIAKKLTPHELHRFESLLLERRRLLLGDLEALEKAEAPGAAGVSAASSNVADFVSDREAFDISLGRRASESTEVQEIDEAVERIRDGSFGLCEDCNQAISRDRLEAIPYTRLCLSCKTAEEI